MLEGRIDPGRVFDQVVSLDEVPDGYRAMNDREAIKVWSNRDAHQDESTQVLPEAV